MVSDLHSECDAYSETDRLDLITDCSAILSDGEESDVEEKFMWSQVNERRTSDMVFFL